ncbi:MAG: pyrroline-5-carboxylate reductase, partial [Rhodocyclales bacterium CG17_big_fil_post_rev_8_21_14_2_50_68_7]
TEAALRVLDGEDAAGALARAVQAACARGRELGDSLGAD